MKRSEGGASTPEFVSGSEFNPRLVMLDGLAQARSEMSRIGADDAGISIMGGKSLSANIAVENLRPRAVHILKEEMLAAGGEAATPRSRLVDEEGSTEVLISGTLKQLRRVAKKLRMQPFGLRRLAVELEAVLDSRFRPEARYSTLTVGGHEWDLRDRTYLMGILNVTPDSFYDGGSYGSLEDARRKALEMEEWGADIIDVGGESTRPGSNPVTLQEEVGRTIPLIEDLAGRLEVPLSIDTYKAEVARRALDAGASMVNDVSGLRFDEGLTDLVADRGIPVIIMHMLGRPKVMQENPEYENLMGEIISFFRERADYAVSAGVDPGNIIIDPGIGFGKTLSHNLEIVRRIQELRSLPFPLLVGTSRKSFIGAVLDLPVDERLEGTAATVAFAIARGADMVRVHDVKEMSRVSRMADALVGKGSYMA